MQHLIEQLIQQQIDAGFCLQSLQDVQGGDINQSRVVIGNNSDGSIRHYFVKTNSSRYAGCLRSEYDALVHLQKFDKLNYPQPLTFSEQGDTACLIISYMELNSLNHQTAVDLAKMLAWQHQQFSDSAQFGWHQDNFIGLSPQKNNWMIGWPEFYSQCRLLPQLEMAVRNKLSTQLVTQIENLMENIDCFFVGYQASPSLLHGDLWLSNAAFDQSSNKAALFDPAIYYGDRETDIAMTELFGRFPPSFYQTYNQAYSLHPNYQQRKPLYNLYHALNHFNLFGDGYQRLVSNLVESCINK